VSRALLAAAVCVLALPAGAGARSRHLWATINVCDTLANPDMIGIRGSMPGSGNPAERMFMRFQVQYLQASTGHWHNIPKGGDSGFQPVGSGRFKARQSGWRFTFAPPAGGAWQMRGAVTFEWRLGAKVERRARLLTTAGHRSTAGSDPPGYSSDTCVIS
jgi:hypothetical protein